jgi:hypothetical protein
MQAEIETGNLVMRARTIAINIALATMLLVIPQTVAFAERANSPSYDTEPSEQYSQAEIDFLAQRVGIYDSLQQLKTLGNNITSENALTQARLQNDVNKRIASIYFDVSAALADLSVEITAGKERSSKLEAKRNNAVSTTNTLNFLVRGAIGIPATAISIPATMLPTDGNILGTIANGTSTGLSLVALGLSRGGRDNENFESMLAPIFFDNVAHDNYPPQVWMYINTIPYTKSGQTHRERLIDSWTRNSLAPDIKSERGAQQLRKLVGLDLAPLSTSDWTKRTKMLIGLKTTIMQMSKGLEHLASSNL